MSNSQLQACGRTRTAPQTGPCLGDHRAYAGDRRVPPCPPGGAALAPSARSALRRSTQGCAVSVSAPARAAGIAAMAGSHGGSMTPSGRADQEPFGAAIIRLASDGRSWTSWPLCVTGQRAPETVISADSPRKTARSAGSQLQDRYRAGRAAVQVSGDQPRRRQCVACRKFQRRDCGDELPAVQVRSRITGLQYHIAVAAGTGQAQQPRIAARPHPRRAADDPCGRTSDAGRPPQNLLIWTRHAPSLM